MKHDFPGLLKDKTAAGTERWRVRVEGKPNTKIRIPSGPGTPGFDDHYYAARAGEKLKTIKPVQVKRGTLDALCDDYLAWLTERVEDPGVAAKDKPSPLTLKGHRSLLKRACDVKDRFGYRMGSLSASLPSAAFIHIRDKFGARTGAADNCIKALRAAYRWGEEREYVKDPEIFLVKKVHKNRGGAEAWTVDDMRKFLRRHGPGTMARLWFLSSLNTLPRINDVRLLGPQHISNTEGEKTIAFQPTKKGSAFVEVPALAQFLEELAMHPEGECFMMSAHGAPYSSRESMRNRVQDWTQQAGLPKGRTQHGIRKGAAELLAAAGATQYEIMALMSHTEAKTSEIYTKRVERKALAATAIKRLSAIDLEKIVDHGP